MSLRAVTQGTIDDRLDMVREPHYEDLDPRRIRLFEDGSGRTRLTIEGDRSYLDVRTVRAFPFSDRERWIGFQDGANRSIGLVEDPNELDPESRALADELLRKHYFLPAVGRVLSLREEFGVVYVDVETDCGRRQFVATGLRDAVVDLGGGELLISDVDGNRYRVLDWRKLDSVSRRFLDRVV